MSKALIIKGASFAQNAVEQITISNPVPCTGIALNKNSITFSAIGATDTLTATLIPADTTEALTWVSSDEDVATVANGVVTCVGVGTATITAYCGEQSASCEVSSSVTINLDTAYHADNGYVYSGSIDLPEKNHIGRQTNSRGRLYYSLVEYGEYRVFTGLENIGKYAIPIPNGTKFITINPPDGLRSYASMALANVNEKQTYMTGEAGQAAMGVAEFNLNSSTSYPHTIDISQYTTANGFVLDVRTSSNGDPSAITGTTEVTFS